MTGKMKALILKKKHNTARNDIALGNIPDSRYNAKNGMSELYIVITFSDWLTKKKMNLLQSWDKELQNIAKFNVKTCIYGHNLCSNTGTMR